MLFIPLVAGCRVPGAPGLDSETWDRTNPSRKRITPRKTPYRPESNAAQTSVTHLQRISPFQRTIEIAVSKESATGHTTHDRSQPTFHRREPGSSLLSLPQNPAVAPTAVPREPKTQIRTEPPQPNDPHPSPTFTATPAKQKD